LKAGSLFFFLAPGDASDETFHLVVEMKNVIYLFHFYFLFITCVQKSSFTRKMAEGGLVMTTNSPTPPPDQQLQEARRERQRRRMTAEMDDLRSKYIILYLL
jgi:hypothetical protein